MTANSPAHPSASPAPRNPAVGGNPGDGRVPPMSSPIGDKPEPDTTVTEPDLDEGERTEVRGNN